MSTLILGATGLCGEGFLKYAVKSSSFTKVFTLTRRELKPEYNSVAKITSVVDKNTEEWVNLIPDNLDCVYTSLSTTRASAGGLEKQYAIDHDFNLKLLESAKNKGCKTVILISSVGAKENSWFPYLKMKGEIERDVLKLNFDHTIILRPGALLGEREGSSFKGFGNGVVTTVFGKAYNTRFSRFLGSPIYGADVGRASVHLAETVTEAPKVQIIEGQELLDLVNRL